MSRRARALLGAAAFSVAACVACRDPNRPAATAAPAGSVAAATPAASASSSVSEVALAAMTATGLPAAGKSPAPAVSGTLASAPTPTPRPHPTEAPLAAPWAGKTNPLKETSRVISRGNKLFLQNCSPCHGPDADGNGPASTGLIPPPANFRDGVRLAYHSDAYLFMRVSNGKHGTAMPAFAGTLSEDERWAILRFLRSLPGAKRKDDE